jgi:hypothetical protein
MITVSKALDYINKAHHGYEAYATEDGLVFKSVCLHKAPEVPNAFYTPLTTYGAAIQVHHYEDDMFEELEVFPIVDGMVSLKAIRDHMGY